jgi:hypothetical protein
MTRPIAFSNIILFQALFRLDFQCHPDCPRHGYRKHEDGIFVLDPNDLLRTSTLRRQDIGLDQPVKALASPLEKFFPISNLTKKYQNVFQSEVRKACIQV